MTRAAALVSGDGYKLQAILDAMYFHELNDFELVAVITPDKNTKAMKRAASSKVPCFVVEPELFPNMTSHSMAVANKLKDLDIELVVCAGFSERLGYSLLHHYKNRVINVQPALFPAFCASDGFDAVSAVEQTLLRGVRITGATAYFMGEEDTGCGPIILQRAIAVHQSDTEATLSERIMRDCEWKVLPMAVRLFCEGRLRVEGEKVYILEKKTDVS